MKARLTASAPILLVKDVVHSSNWYRDKLGFEIVSLYGYPPHFSILRRDGHYLMFCKCLPEKIVANWKLVDKTSNVYFWVDDVEKLYEEYKASGATIDWHLCIQPYGVKEFGINDPDEYDIAFGQVL
ncbi:MAG TPA: VOC family protein [Chitinophagaceae bacterium]